MAEDVEILHALVRRLDEIIATGSKRSMDISQEELDLAAPWIIGASTYCQREPWTAPALAARAYIKRYIEEVRDDI